MFSQSGQNNSAGYQYFTRLHFTFALVVVLTSRWPISALAATLDEFNSLKGLSKTELDREQILSENYQHLARLDRVHDLTLPEIRELS